MSDRTPIQPPVFKRTHIALSAQRPPLCLQHPRADEDFWRIRWRIVSRLYKWNAHAAEAAQLLSLAHIPTTDQFTAEWLHEHNMQNWQTPLYAHCGSTALTPRNTASTIAPSSHLYGNSGHFK
ncbi:hypothetical protein V1514DRAFT_323016, partial [Lipomyces japonicus]|uniref:uncharacterized protein n=1 Tax=Lipomyces japonicus TaxID=56871 RepID=UPI0034CD569A